MLLPKERFILAIGDVETPVAGILNAPMAPDGVREALHAHRETADVIANLHRLLPIANAPRLHHADRFQTLPEFPLRQALRYRHLNVAPGLFTPMPPLPGLMPARLHIREVVLALLVDVVD